MCTLSLVYAKPTTTYSPLSPVDFGFAYITFGKITFSRWRKYENHSKTHKKTIVENIDF